MHLIVELRLKAKKNMKKIKKGIIHACINIWNYI